MIKYTDEIKRKILDLKIKGFSSRKIAELTGVSKSGVNQYIGTLGKIKPNILFVDIETAPSLVYSFDRFNVNIPYTHVKTEGNWIISAAWAWNDSNVESIVCTPFAAQRQDDSAILSKLYELYKQADVVVAYNGKKFDFKIIETRFLLNFFGPAPTVKYYDPYQVAKKLKFNSNKLDAVANNLNLENKIQNSGINLWIRCMQGEESALKEMQEYNEQDIVVLRQVYNTIRAFDKSHPNVNLFVQHSEDACTVCGSLDVVESNRFVYTPAAESKEYVCNNCGHFHYHKGTKVSKPKQLVNAK